MLRAYRGDKCLEIGFGSGAVLHSVAHRFDLAVGTDVLTLEQARAAVADNDDDVEVVLADRATCFRAGVFDLVTFNPPYLPSEGIQDRTVDGGKDGLEVPLAFLEDGLRVLKPEGKVVLLISDASNPDEFRRVCESKRLVVAEKANEVLFFENLFVFEVSRMFEG